MTGVQFLGGFIGSHSERDEYVMSKVQWWVGHLDLLSEAALTQPQLAYAALSRSLQHKWTFCCVLSCSVASYFRNLKCHFSLVLPAMFGVEVSAVERCLFALPFQLGSLGICNPVSLAFHLFNSSVHSTEHLVKSIVGLRLLSWILILIVFLLISCLIVSS